MSAVCIFLGKRGRYLASQIIRMDFAIRYDRRIRNGTLDSCLAWNDNATPRTVAPATESVA
jgi:hypothetical protein